MRFAVIMAQWKRQSSFRNTVSNLNNQTFKNFDLFLWNNNKNNYHYLTEYSKESVGYKTHIHNSNTNMFGFGRFLMAKNLINNKIDGFCGEDYEYAVFFDDDQMLEPNFLEYLSVNAGKKKYAGQHAFKIKNNRYGDRDRCSCGENADYVGTGGSIIDISFFKDDEFFVTYLQDEDVFWLEDIALTLFCKKIGWSTVGLGRKYIRNLLSPEDINFKGQHKSLGRTYPKSKGYLKLKKYYLGE